MQIKTRKQARRDGDNTYFTGKECRNGHLSYRYSQSGTCYLCINGDRINNESSQFKARSERLASVSAQIIRKDEIKAALVQIKVPVYSADLEVLTAAVLAFGVMRFPELTIRDVFPSTGATDGLYRFNCHLEDVAQIRAYAETLWSARPSQFKIDHAARLEKLTSEYAKVDPIPSWADKP